MVVLVCFLFALWDFFQNVNTHTRTHARTHTWVISGDGGFLSQHLCIHGLGFSHSPRAFRIAVAYFSKASRPRRYSSAAVAALPVSCSWTAPLHVGGTTSSSTSVPNRTEQRHLRGHGALLWPDISRAVASTSHLNARPASLCRATLRVQLSQCGPSRRVQLEKLDPHRP